MADETASRIPTVNGDRLVRLSMTRAAIRHAGVDSADAWRSAPAEVRGRLEPDRRALVDRAVREDRADVIAALWSPVEWHAAELQTGPANRLLVIEGQAPIGYRADDPNDERRAWAAIRAATARR